MNVRSIVFAALIASTGPVFAQPPAGAEPRARTPQPAQTPRGGGPGSAQAPRTPAAAPAAEAPVPRARREGQPINIRVEVAITDQRGGAAPVKKTVSVVVADSYSGRIRSSAESTGGFNMPLNVDAEPNILPDGKIRLMLNLQYDLPSGGATGEPPSNVGAIRRTQLQENLPLILESGKATIVAQSADPIGDRQVTVELKATILK